MIDCVFMAYTRTYARRGSELVGNTAPQGGAIFVDGSSSVVLNSTIHFYNNTATQPSSGGGAIYLASGAQLTMDRRVVWVLGLGFGGGEAIEARRRGFFCYKSQTQTQTYTNKHAAACSSCPTSTTTSPPPAAAWPAPAPPTPPAAPAAAAPAPT